MPLDRALLATAREAPVLAVVGAGADPGRVDALRSAGAEVDVVPGAHGPEFLGGALDALGRRGVQSLLVEGGPTVAGALLDAGLVDVLAWVVAPMVIGGDGAPTAARGIGADAIADAPRILSPRIERVGDDVLVMGRLRPVPEGG
jgi:diaminohydroxyphosphoribosylaminopyrimidine deaminase/5-amino-6-(5-phosphoribosylamino)uracil reductase